ncbi:HEAT repeat domain-containing protein [Aurantiacibacter poecillastricola]|uniref:HEAT repeat domain-containing protein n=1 Tax=Aurantiacibacter poecillastricola TaxID=3064385 RepID=UPI00273E86F0|nr:HEAT repeat domain-containing protein [Aurantiacibacter sp. 219JJ12-13]MDP5263066.1 HEAT repeat domain-containing protein [Aurantiacibacter sp. 219JJ12-13]
MNAYEEIVLGTTICAAGILVLFLLLVLRRYLEEHTRMRRDERDAAITRSYLQRVAGHRVDLADGWEREARLSAISRILPLLRGGEKTRLLQIAELDGVLDETVRKSRSIYRTERINAIHFLQRFGSEACIARLREIMARDRDPKVRLEAAFALASNGALPPPRETLRLLKGMHRKPTRLDIALLRATAPLYPEQMVMLLEDDLDVAWRSQIIDALGWSADMSIIDVLGRSAADPEPEIRSAALRASARLGHPVAARWVLAALQDPVTSVRLQAIAASRQLEIRDAVPELLRLCGDSQLWVRLRAEQALEHLAPESLEAPVLEARA